MGFLDIFKKKKNTDYKTAPYLDGYYPRYSQFGNNIYASDVVQQCVFAIVSELKKLDLVHIRTGKNNDFVPVKGNIQSILDQPNPLMSTSDYLEKISWNLLLNYNSFIYPMWNGDTLVGLYPLQPSNVEFLQDKQERVWIKFYFANNYNVEMPYSDIIHIRYKYSVSEYMGGNKYGQPDHKALLKTLQLDETLLEGVAKGLKMQTSVNAVLKLKTMANTEAQMKEIEKFEAKLRNNESGLLPIDISSEYVPMSKGGNLVDQTMVEYIDTKIMRYFGVSKPIIDRDYTAAQYEAFYQSTLEPIIKSMSEAHTKGLFTTRENGFGNKIRLYAKELIFTNTSQKLEYYKMMVDIGGCYCNEIRNSFGQRPLAELDGVLATSSNKQNAENNTMKEEGEANE